MANRYVTPASTTNKSPGKPPTRRSTFASKSPGSTTHAEHERRRDGEGAHVDRKYGGEEKDGAEHQDRQQLDGHRGPPVPHAGECAMLSHDARSRGRRGGPGHDVKVRIEYVRSFSPCVRCPQRPEQPQTHEVNTMPLYLYQAAYTAESLAAQMKKPADRFRRSRNRSSPLASSS